MPEMRQLLPLHTHLLTKALCIMNHIYSYVSIIVFIHIFVHVALVQAQMM